MHIDLQVQCTWSHTYCSFAHQNDQNSHSVHRIRHMTSHKLHLSIENLHHMDMTINLRMYMHVHMSLYNYCTAIIAVD